MGVTVGVVGFAGISSVLLLAFSVSGDDMLKDEELTVARVREDDDDEEDGAKADAPPTRADAAVRKAMEIFIFAVFQVL